jgi:hypothetical protein
LASRWKFTQIQAHPEILYGGDGSIAGQDSYLIDTDPKTNPNNDPSKKVDPALWLVRTAHHNRVTVLRIMAFGMSSDFQLVLEPGTQGADGTSPANGRVGCQGLWERSAEPTCSVAAVLQQNTGIPSLDKGPIYGCQTQVRMSYSAR